MSYMDKNKIVFICGICAVLYLAMDNQLNRSDNEWNFISYILLFIFFTTLIIEVFYTKSNKKNKESNSSRDLLYFTVFKMAPGICGVLYGAISMIGSNFSNIVLPSLIIISSIKMIQNSFNGYQDQHHKDEMKGQSTEEEIDNEKQ